MGFKIGRPTDAPVLEVRKTARYGEQKIVATETPVTAEPSEETESADGGKKPKRTRKTRKTEK